VIATEQLPAGLDMTREQVVAMAKQLRVELARQEAVLLSPYPSEHPTAGATAGA
jgi:broad specificity phosphatase PhoE